MKLLDVNRKHEERNQAALYGFVGFCGLALNYLTGLKFPTARVPPLTYSDPFRQPNRILARYRPFFTSNPNVKIVECLELSNAYV